MNDGRYVLDLFNQVAQKLDKEGFFEKLKQGQSSGSNSMAASSTKMKPLPDHIKKAYRKKST